MRSNGTLLEREALSNGWSWLLVCFCLAGMFQSCTAHKPEHSMESVTEPVVQETVVKEQTEPTFVIIDDATGEVLGVMVNEVGDYYVMNPGDEVIVPKNGHSIKEVQRKLP